MKYLPFSMRATAILLAVSVFISNPRRCHAQMGTQKWHFQNRGQVQQAVLKNLRNLRASYEIITCAGQQGMTKTVLYTYEQVMGKSVFNKVPPEVYASYSIAHHWLTFRPLWTWKQDTFNIPTRGGTEAIQVTLFRERALKALPRSPEVLLENAIWLAYQQGKRPEALRQIEEAVRRAPNWADAHYWHAVLLNLKSMVSPVAQKPRYGVTTLRALAKAEKLDPGFVNKDLAERDYAYEIQGKYKESLAAFDAYVRFYPEYPRYLDKEFGPGRYRSIRDEKVAKAKA